MDRNTFFREVTLRICGSLKIEEALFSTFTFLRDVMPVDVLVLEHVDNYYGSMRTLAMATEAGGEAVDTLTPLSKEAQAEAKETLYEGPKAFLLEDPHSEKVADELLNFHDMKATSVVVLILESDPQMLGSLVVISQGEKRLTEDHKEQLASVREPFAIALSNAMKHREVIKLKDLLTDDNRYLQGELRRLSGDEIVGANFGLKQVMMRAQQVASLDSPVLLLGETGTGKDVLAHYIHSASSRSKGPFISVNCGAIPDTLIDSELFGHEKGAFTGALAQKRGRFERANGGTIFLDEIGELPLQAQVRLLSVIQNREIERVGGVKSIPLDIRIIAATHRNLEEMIKENLFREDLWFRLNVFPLMVPPLRERKTDIPALVQHFINQKSKDLKLSTIPTLKPGAINYLLEYHWPGNVRELENIVERALILNPTGPLSFEEFMIGMPTTNGASYTSKEPRSLDTVVSTHIRKILSQTNGKVSGPDGAADILGVNPSTLRNKMRKLQIPFGKKAT
ncbi:sigma-54-dependent Fis family transcriptional regulator [Pseudodesulfovibrio sp. zrk46]|uniref:sigma-54 interaction domain-containing protein n=1 Tax=Pseudodesulfovibrio sp. zrk46 TaxID=2725288 RepID=UPI00144A194B|nr:sigma-54-dependent Fis family transcriptional regulator [Pseudodesulfovibrio sp. zrk46]QJB56832.1 sigma-54-dependent Fis family transcriptional regulator [Pseudodesulfovibrio sp. zrk46]